MAGILGGKPSMSPPPAPPPPPPTIDTSEVQSAAAEERNRRARAEGRASTMLTRQQGSEMTDDVSIARKKLLGQ